MSLDRNTLLVCLFTTLGLLVAAGDVFARMDLATSLALREEYFDNLFLTPDGEDEDFVTQITPGLQLTTETKILRADLRYALEFRFYRDNTHLDETSLKDTQRLFAEGTFFPDRDFELRLLDEYSRVIIDQSQPTSEANPFINKSNLNRFVANPRYRLRRFETWEPEISYLYTKLNYTSREADDSEDHRVNASLTKRLRNNLRFRVLYGYEQLDSESPDQATDYSRQDGRFNLEAEPSSRLSLGLEVGKAWINFSGREGQKAALWNGWLGYKLTPRVNSRLQFSQDFSNSPDQGLVKVQAGNFSLDYTGDRQNGDLTVFYSRDTYQEITREDKSTGGRANFKHPLTQKLDLGLNGYLTFYRFSESGRGVEDAVRWGAGGDFNYQLRILKLSLGYLHEESDSEVNGNDYRSNVAYVQASAEF